MKIAFIYPQVADEKTPLHMPLDLGVLAAIGQSYGYSVAILDLNALRPTSDAIRLELAKEVAKWDAVIIYAKASQYEKLKQLAAIIRKLQPQVVIIASGPLLTTMPKEVMRWVPQIDLAPIGDWELTFPTIIDSIENRNWDSVKGIIYRGRNFLIETEKQLPIKAPDDIPMPAYHFFVLEAYFANSSLPFGIGALASKRRMEVKWQRGTTENPVFNSVQYAVNQIVKLRVKYGLDHLTIQDRNICTDEKRIYGFCDAFEKADLIGALSFSIYGDIKIMNQELLRRLKEVGCDYVEYEQTTPFDADQNEQLTRIVSRALNIGISAHFALKCGFPNDSFDNVYNIINFCKRNNFNITPMIYVPTPDLPEFQVHKKQIEEYYNGDLEKFLIELGENRPITANLSPWNDVTLLGIQQLIGANDETRLKKWVNNPAATSKKDNQVLVEADSKLSIHR